MFDLKPATLELERAGSSTAVVYLCLLLFSITGKIFQQKYYITIKY